MLSNMVQIAKEGWSYIVELHGGATQWSYIVEAYGVSIDKRLELHSGEKEMLLSSAFPARHHDSTFQL